MDTTELFDRVKVNGKEYAVDPTSDVRINRADLNGDIETHAEKFGFYATAYELAVEQEMLLKAELDRTYARMDIFVRASFESANIKATEKKVENEVILRPEYMEAQKAHREAATQVGLLKAQRDAMLHRRDMLVALAHNYRAEGFSDLSLKADAVKSKSAK